MFATCLPYLPAVKTCGYYADPFVRNVIEFVHTLYSVDLTKEYHVQLQHNLTARMPIRKAINLLGEHFRRTNTVLP